MGYNHFHYARRIDADTIGLYHEDMTKLLQIDKATANKTVIKGQGVTGDILSLYGNAIDARGSIDIIGNGGITMNANDDYHFYHSGVKAVRFDYGSNVSTIMGGNVTGDDLVMKCNGIDADNITIEGSGDISFTPTGNVKFGAYTGTPATDSTGFITIKDAGGNTRKLMVQA